MCAALSCVHPPLSSLCLLTFSLPFCVLPGVVVTLTAKLEQPSCKLNKSKHTVRLGQIWL